jgi:agmatinase
MSQETAFSYLRHGQIPFFRLPVADARLGAEAYAGADAVLLGVPYDGGTTYQPGARLGPYAIRRVSALVQSYHPEHDVDVFGSLRVLDGGNVVFPPFDAAQVRERIEAEVAAIAALSAAPFVVGGDHSVALPVWRALAKLHGPIALVHIDAHADTSGPEVWGERFHHGAPIRHALTENLIAHGQLYQIGLRGPQGTRADRELALAHDAQIVSADLLADEGPGAIAAAIRRRIGDRPAHITFDIDAIDPAHAPGTGTPVPAGLSAREALSLVRHLAGLRLVGMDLVEVCPPLDHADLTAHLAAHLLFEGVALLAVSE